MFFVITVTVFRQLVIPAFYASYKWYCNALEIGFGNLVRF